MFNTFICFLNLRKIAKNVVMKCDKIAKCSYNFKFYIIIKFYAQEDGYWTSCMTVSSRDAGFLFWINLWSYENKNYYVHEQGGPIFTKIEKVKNVPGQIWYFRFRKYWRKAIVKGDKTSKFEIIRSISSTIEAFDISSS